MGKVDIQIYYSQQSNGPGKVIKNLSKGLSTLDVSYNLNEPPVSGTKKICLSNHSILKSHIKELFIGPNICTLPIDNKIVMQQEYKKYIVNSNWTFNAYKKWIPESKLDIWSVGIDTDLFCDTSGDKKEYDCLVYFKRRSETDLNYIKEFLEEKKQTYNIVKYGKYSEDEFINLISKSKYGIVIDNCESQGIAIQEMMSCNLPLFVWDVKFWNDRGEENKVESTSIPFWDDSCGLSFYNKEEMCEKWDEFILNLQRYNPRKYILDNLTLEKQAKEIIKILEE